jgi:hypothetical protein
MIHIDVSIYPDIDILVDPQTMHSPKFLTPQFHDFGILGLTIFT